MDRRRFIQTPSVVALFWEFPHSALVINSDKTACPTYPHPLVPPLIESEDEGI